MDSSKLAIKFFLKDAAGTDVKAFVPVFHRWIQTHAMQEHQLIDVADYKHVPEGPGTVLVSHEANLFIDEAEHRPGLLYVRKHTLDGDLAAKIGKTIHFALLACKMLEQDEAFAGKVSFRTDNPLFRIYDRLNAPNTAETFAEVKPVLESALAKFYKAPVKLAHTPNAETVFEAKVTASSSPGVAELI